MEILSQEKEKQQKEFLIQLHLNQTFLTTMNKLLKSFFQYTLFDF